MDDTRVENWRPVPGTGGRYEASDLGRIRSRPARQAGRVLRTRTSGQSPYLGVSVYVNGRKRSLDVHTLVALTWLGPRPEGQQVRHLNGDHLDCRAANLAYGTPTENQLDIVRHGRNREALKTECPRGHEYDPSNTGLRRGPRGGLKRACRNCDRDRQRARRATATAHPSRKSDHPP